MTRTNLLQICLPLPIPAVIKHEALGGAFWELYGVSCMLSPMYMSYWESLSVAVEEDTVV